MSDANQQLLARIQRIANRKFSDEVLRALYVERMYNELKEESDDEQEMLVKEEVKENIKKEEKVEPQLEAENDQSDIESVHESDCESDCESVPSTDSEPEHKEFNLTYLNGHDKYLYCISFDNREIYFGNKKNPSYYDLLKCSSKRRAQSLSNKVFKRKTADKYESNYWEYSRYNHNFDNFEDSVKDLMERSK